MLVQSGRIKQKFGRKYKKRRAWDLFSHLSKEIVTDLKAFKMYNVNTVPGNLYDKVARSYGYSVESIPDDKYKLIDEESTRQWKSIIDEMIWSFEEISNEHHNSPMYKVISEYHERYPQLPGESIEDFFNSKKNRPGIWDVYNYEEVKKEQEEYNARVDKGLHLFAEWFEALWD